MRKTDRFATAVITYAAAWSVLAALVAIPLSLLEAIVVWWKLDCWMINRTGRCSETVIRAVGVWPLFFPAIVAGLVALIIVVRYRHLVRALLEKQY